MPINLLKRSELARGLTNAEQDGNLTALETFINNILAGTPGYQAGDALKLAGQLGTSFWTDANCPGTILATGWQKLKSGLIIQWGAVTLTSINGYFSLPVAFTTANYRVYGQNYSNVTNLVYVHAYTAAQFQGSVSSGSIATEFFAIGY